MNTLRRLSALRFYLRHPGQLALAIAGIALGVAVVVAVDLANASALRAFELSRALTAGRASHIVQAAVGDLPEEVYRRLRVEHGVAAATPVVEGPIRWQGKETVTLDLLGVDPFAEIAFDDSMLGSQSRGHEAARIRALLTEADAVLLPAPLADRLGLGAGDRLRVHAAGGARELAVKGTITLASAPGASAADLVIADISSAQEILGRVGYLTRIELAVPDRIAEQLAAELPTGVTITAVDSADAIMQQMLRAFRINLTALSLLALVVGMLLIYATMSFAIVQRRASLGTLRSLGVTRDELARDVLVESAALGMLATALGLTLGWALSGALVDLVLATINDLYFRTRVSPEGLTPLPFIKGALLGVAATILAALRPALEAAQEQPRAAMSRIAYEHGMRRRFATGPLLAAFSLLAALVLILLPAKGLLAAFLGLFMVLAGYALLVPPLTAAILSLIRRASGRSLWLSLRYAVRGAIASLSRTGIAVTALAVAVATVVGIGVMIDSFRASVTEWLDHSLTADFYVVTREEGNGGFTAAEIAAVEAIQGVVGVSLSRTNDISTSAGIIPVRAARAGPRGYTEELIEGDPEEAFAALEAGDGILLAEPFARRRGFALGNMLLLPAPKRDVELRIVGIFRDYRTSDSGAMLPYEMFSSLWGYRPPLGIGVYLHESADSDAIGSALEEFAAGREETTVVANREIRRITLEIFDRTFEITGVLRLLAGIIAFFGILSSLLALQLERSREVATLRAIGFTRRQTAANSLAQTTLLGGVSGLLALPLGIALAGLLIFVINERSFGWSMGFVVMPSQLAIGLLLAVLAALLAGIYPALRLADQPIHANLQSD